MKIRGIMYQSIPSLTIPSGIRTFSLPGGSGFCPTIFARGLNWKNFLQFWKKNTGTSRFVSKKPEAALQSRGYFAVSCQFLQKTVDIYCVPFSAILIKFSGHPRVMFANARSSLKFWVSYIARTIINILSVSRLFRGVFLMHSQSGKPKNKLVLIC